MVKSHWSRRIEKGKGVLSEDLGLLQPLRPPYSHAPVIMPHLSDPITLTWRCVKATTQPLLPQGDGDQW